MMNQQQWSSTQGNHEHIITTPPAGGVQHSVYYSAGRIPPPRRKFQITLTSLFFIDENDEGRMKVEKNYTARRSFLSVVPIIHIQYDAMICIRQLLASQCRSVLIIILPSATSSFTPKGKQNKSAQEELAPSAIGQLDIKLYTISPLQSTECQILLSSLCQSGLRTPHLPHWPLQAMCRMYTTAVSMGPMTRSDICQLCMSLWAGSVCGIGSCFSNR